MLSPYVLDYAARISVILLPWAALPWLIGHGDAGRPRRADGGTRRCSRSWSRSSAASTRPRCSSRASGPCCGSSTHVGRERDRRPAGTRCGRPHRAAHDRRLAVVDRRAVGARAVRPRDPALHRDLRDRGRGLDAPEMLRGLGYWFFYGDDSSARGSSRASPTRSICGSSGSATCSGSARRSPPERCGGSTAAYFVALLAIGMLIAVGSHPVRRPVAVRVALRPLHPSRPRARAAHDAARGAAGRPRARGAARRRSRVRSPGGVRQLGPRGRGDGSGRRRGHQPAAALHRPDGGRQPAAARGACPPYWQRRRGLPRVRGRHDTRVLELPGADFASYRWGNTVDPITPGLMDRPYVARELIPYGSAPSADLLNASTAGSRRAGSSRRRSPRSPRSWASARSTSAPTCSTSATARPVRATCGPTSSATPGLGAPAEFGDPVPNRAIPELPLIDEVALGTPPDAADPPPVAAFPVERTRPIVRAESRRRRDAHGGQRRGHRRRCSRGRSSPRTNRCSTRRRSRAIPTGMQRALDDDAHLVLTDTNRRQARRWGTVRENVGYTERAGEKALVDDPTDNRLEVFPGAGDDTMTTVEQRGVARVDATVVRQPLSLHARRSPRERDRRRPADRVAGRRVLGCARRAVGGRADRRGDDDHLTFLQPITGSRNRFITRCGSTSTVAMPSTWARRVVTRRHRASDRHRLAHLHDAVDRGPRHRRRLPPELPRGSARWASPSSTWPASKVDEVVRLPTDLLTAAGTSSIDHPLDVVMTRQRSQPRRAGAHRRRGDVDPAGVRPSDGRDVRARRGRPVERPGSRHAARHAARAAGCGRPVASPPRRRPGSTATYRARVLRDRRRRRRRHGRRRSRSCRETSPPTPSAEPFTFDHLDLVVFADGRHSVPTELTITADDGTPVVVAVPAIADDPSRRELHGRQCESTSPQPITATKLAIQLSRIRPVTTIDYYSETPVTMPVGIAEWGIAGLSVPPLASTIDTRMRPVPRDQRACGQGAGHRPHRRRPRAGRDGAERVRRRRRDRARGRGTGQHRPARTRARHRSGRVALGQPAARASRQPASLTAAAADRHRRGRRTGSRTSCGSTTPPRRSGSCSARAERRLEGDGEGPGSLGSPTLIDGYANGWYVTPTGSRTDRDHAQLDAAE